MGFLVSLSAWANTDLWQLETQRGDARLPVLVESVPDVPVHGLLLSLDTGSGKDVVKSGKNTPSYGQPTTLITRNRASLAAQGIVVLTPGTPSDQPGGMDFNWRHGLEHRADLETLIKAAHNRYPGVPLVVHGYFSGATSALNLAESRTGGVDGYVLTSGVLTRLRDDSLDKINTRGLIVQPISHNCNEIPTPEAREVAAAAHWQYLSISDSQSDAKPTCNTSSRAGLRGQDKAFVEMLLAWISGAAAPAALGKQPATLVYDEQVYMIPSASVGVFGRHKIELSVFTPPGKGPFPVLLYNHGDILPNSSYITAHQRYRDMPIVNEFIAMGIAVAMPARPGVGRSDGVYQRYSGVNGVYIGAPTGLLQKGRDQLAEGLAALEFLHTIPTLDTSRVIMAGQSAGGFAVSCLGLDNPSPDWLKAVINFSGGRTDVPEGQHADHYNEGMVNIFGYLGKTSRIPALWIFAEHDSRYTAETIRAAHKAFTEAGGIAELHLYPQLKDTDGHFVYHAPELWREDARRFLARLGLTEARAVQVKAPDKDTKEED
ncbi:alpha/beta hydrolase family protein [Uliginosibacterium gangwonense]|uniref:alpha/beta hydrolase family protein n=1 Tax=Uliginosibacterium gangwonense TaxID=392736 RepID=UPI0012F88F96|nr:hypothetical protein [Uliginosibacterium gangwonense]